MNKPTKERRLRKWIKAEIDHHLAEAQKLYAAGSFAAGRWEDGFVMALAKVRDRLNMEGDES